MRFHCFLLYKKIATFHWNGTHGWILNFSLQRVVLWVALIHLVIEQRTCIIIVAPVYALMLIRISLIPRSRAYKYGPRSRALEPGLIRLFFYPKQCFSLTDSFEPSKSIRNSDKRTGTWSHPLRHLLILLIVVVMTRASFNSIDPYKNLWTNSWCVHMAYAAQHYHWSYAFRGNNDFQKYIIYIILCWSVGPISEAPPTRAEGTAQPLAVAWHEISIEGNVIHTYAYVCMYLLSSSYSVQKLKNKESSFVLS